MECTRLMLDRGCLPFQAQFGLRKGRAGSSPNPRGSSLVLAAGPPGSGPSGRWARVPTPRLVSTSSALTRLRSPSPGSGLFSRFHGGPRGCPGWWGLQAPLRKGRGCCPSCCPQGPGLGAPCRVGARRSSRCPPRSRVGAASRAAWRPASGSCQQRVAPIGIPSTAWALCSPGSESGLLLSAQLWCLSPDR